MLEKDKRIILQLIFSTMSGDNAVQNFAVNNTNIDWNAIYNLLKKHDLTHILAYILQQNKLLDKNTEAGGKLSQAMLTAVYRYERLYFEQERIQECLKTKNIPFIFLKGSVLRHYYPEPWLRTSCDIDLLVPIDKLAEVCKWIEKELGYRIEDKGTYDVSLFAENGIHLEIHTLMEGDGAERKLLSRVWDTAYSKGNSEFFMSNEMFYFYHIAHMAKHFRGGGCGIRSFLDLKVLQKRFKYNREIVDQLLVEWGLKQFEEYAIRLADCWASGVKDENLSVMEKYIFYGGIYGVMEQHVAARKGKDTAAQYIRKRIFMPYEELKKRYKILEKHKWLTPIFEIGRWFSVFNPQMSKQAIKELEKLQTMDIEKQREITQMFSNLGL